MTIFISSFYSSATCDQQTFSEWENDYLNYLSNGGDASEYQEGELDNEASTDVNNNQMNKNQLAEALETLRKLKLYSSRNGNQSLFEKLDSTIRELEWLISGGSNAVQPMITRYFQMI